MRLQLAAHLRTYLRTLYANLPRLGLNRAGFLNMEGIVFSIIFSLVALGT